MSGSALISMSTRAHDVLVIGGGIGGLTVAHTIATRDPWASVLLLEAGPRTGGQVATTVEDGYTFEHGPSAATLGAHDAGLLDELGLRSRAEQARPDATRGSLYVGGELHDIPRSPRQLVGSRLLSARGKLRTLAEPVVARPATEDDESVHAFAARRFGHEFADVVAATALQGITGGDAHRTSLRSLSPELHALERSCGAGGLLGAIARRTRGASAHPLQGAFTLRDGGLQVLVDALTDALRGRLRLHARVVTLRRASGGYVVILDDGGAVVARQVVLALPACAAAPLLEDLEPGAAAALGEVRYCPLQVVGLGYPREAFRVMPRGLGFLVAPREDVQIAGVTAASNLFPDQAPPGHVLVRAFAGGAYAPDAARDPAPVAVARAVRALRMVYGVDGEPTFVLRAVWPQATPQYEPGHAARVEGIRRALDRHPGLELLPTAHTGVGLQATIAAARRLAGRVRGRAAVPAGSGS